MVAGGARRAAQPRRRPPASTRSPASACRARCTARCSSTPPATRSARRCCGTTRAPTPSATRSTRAAGPRPRDRDHRQPRQHRASRRQSCSGCAPTSRRLRPDSRSSCLPKDFIRFRLTGEHATDAADASGTLFLDLRRRRYSEEMLAALDIPELSCCPRCSKGPEVTGRLTAAAAALTGLPAGTPWSPAAATMPAPRSAPA